MAYTVEINGVDVEFENRPTEQDIDAAASAMASRKPESRMPKPVEGEGGAAFGVYRPAGRRPESQQNREASAEMGLQTARGVASNVPAILGIPGSVANAVANAPRTVQDITNRYQRAQEAFTGRAPQEQPLPERKQVTPYDMGFFGQMVPGPEPTTPQGQLAFSAGQLVGAPIVPKVPGAIKSTVQGVREAVPAVKQFAEGATGVATGTIAKPGAKPEVWQKSSSRIPAEETHYPADLQEKWRKGEITTDEMNRGRIEWTEEQRRQLEKTRGNVPVEGQIARAAGEQFMEPHMGLKGWVPELAAAGVGGMVGGPIGAAVGTGLTLANRARNALNLQKQIGAMNELGKVGFTPQTAAEIEALQRGAPHPVAGPVFPSAPQPTTNYPLTVQGPGTQLPPSTIPMSGPQRNVNIEGESFNLPQQIDVTNSQAARPQAQPIKPTGTPKQISQQVAASKIQPVQPAEPTPLPPSAQLEQQLRDIDQQTTQLHSENVGRVQPDTPEGQMYQKQMDEQYRKYKDIEKQIEEAKKAEKEAEKKAKKESKKKAPNASQMMSAPDTGWIPEKFKTPELTVAILKEGGEWKQGDLTIKYQDLGGGDARIQVRKNGMVIEEYYK